MDKPKLPMAPTARMPTLAAAAWAIVCCVVVCVVLWPVPGSTSFWLRLGCIPCFVAFFGLLAFYGFRAANASK